MTLIGGATCSSCSHRFRQDARIILCRRYPPQIVMVPLPGPANQVQPSVQAYFPAVAPDARCGEYQRNEGYAMQEVADQALATAVKQ